jgi:hypothetical protein
MASRDECADAIARLLLTLPALPYGWGEMTTDARAEMWALILRDLSLTDLRRACAAWTTGEHCQRMPAPGELLRLARPVSSDADLGSAGREAWRTVQALRQRYREANGYGFGWREGGEAAMAEALGPAAWAALGGSVGVLAIERARLMSEADAADALSKLEACFVGDYRAAMRRGALGLQPLDRPQIGAAPTRAIGADADLAPSVAERLRVHAMRGAS